MLKKDVLRGQISFNNVYRKGKSVGDRKVVVFYIKNNLGYSRIGFLASKKVGNSVERNRARRLMKECFRKIRADIPAGLDIVIIARNTIVGSKCSEVEDSLFSALRRCGILKKVKK